MKNEELDHILEKSFRSEPGFSLPANFANKVALLVIRREHWKTDVKEYLSIVALVLALLAVAAGTYFWADKVFFMKIVDFATQNLIPLILIVLILNFVFFADRVLLRLLFNRWSKP